MTSVAAPERPPTGTAQAGPRRSVGDRWAALDAGGMRTFWVVATVVLLLQFVGFAVYSAYLDRRFDLTDDFATYAQAWWSIGHGHLDPVDTVQTPTYPFWQSHFELAMWPIAFVGRLWPHPVQLLWLQDAALVAAEWIAGVWAAAICAERIGRTRVAVALVALGFLVANVWWYMAASFDVHFETLGLPFVVLSGYSLWRGRRRTAVIAAVLGLLFGDVVALAVLCVGLGGLVSSRARRRCGVATPLVVVAVSAAWVLLATLLDANKGSGIVTNYGYLVGAAPGASSAWVVEHLLLHPFHVAHVFFDRLGGVGRVLASAGLVGVATPWGFFVALGNLGPVALNANRGFLSPSIAFQTITVIPFVFVGSVMVLLRIAGRRESRTTARSGAPDPHDGQTRAHVDVAPLAARGTAEPRWRVAIAIVLALVLMIVAFVQSAPLYSSIRADWWRVGGPTAAALSAAQSRVPPGAETIVSQGVIGRFATRTEAYPLLAAPQRFPVRAGEVVFVIVPSAGIESIPASAARADVTSLVGREGAVLVSDSNGVAVLTWKPPRGVSSVVLP